MSRADRLHAAQVAAEVLDEYEVDQNHPIDPFALIQAMGLTLSITRLDNLLGALLPRGTGGVLITSERPPSVQRYTAAHEIGHWRLHRDYAADGDEEIFGGTTELEREAQVFASYLLMPEPIFQDAVSRYQVHKGAVTPEQVYLLSRDLYVSFEAAARRLQVAHYLQGSDVSAFRNPGRLKALQSVFDGLRPADGYADMWSVGLSSGDEATHVTVGERDEVVVTLPEHRLSGWRWLRADELANRRQNSIRRERPRPPWGAVNERPELQLDTQEPAASHVTKRPAELNAVLALLPQPAPRPARGVAADVDDDLGPMPIVSDLYSAPTPSTTSAALRRLREDRAREGSTLSTDAEPLEVGGMGTRRVVMRCNEAGEWSLDLHYADAYDARIEPVQDFRVDVTVQPTPTHAFQRRLLESDLDERLPGDPDDATIFEIDPS